MTPDPDPQPVPGGQPMRFRESARGLAAMAALVLASFGTALGHGFVSFDDPDYLTENPAVRDARHGMAAIWTTPRMPAHATNWPLVFTSFWVEHRLWGLRPAGYHATNLALHALAAWLLAAWLRRLGIGPAVAWTAAAWFAAHPLHAESVAWVTERKNVLCGAFFFASLALHAAWRRDGGAWRYAAHVLAAAAALLSKSAAVPLPSVTFVVDLVWFRRGARDAAMAALPSAALAAAMALWTLHGERSTHPLASMGQRLPLAAMTTGFYAVKLAAPHGLMPFHPLWRIDPADPVVWLPTALLAAAIVAVAAGRRHLPPAVPFGLAVFLVMLLPVCGVAQFGFMRYSYVADRMPYLASAGFLLAAAAAWHAAADRRRWSPQGRWIPVAVATLALVAIAVPTTLRWRSSATLYAGLESETDNLNALLAKVRWSQAEPARLDESLALLRRLVERFPESPDPYVILGSLAARNGRAEMAKGAFAKAVGLRRAAAAARPDDPLAVGALAMLHYDLGEWDDALEQYRRLDAIEPSPEAWRTIATILLRQGRFAEAAAALDRELANAPRDLWLLRARAAAASGAGESAAPWRLRILAVDPDDGAARAAPAEPPGSLP